MSYFGIESSNVESICILRQIVNGRHCVLCSIERDHDRECRYLQPVSILISARVAMHSAYQVEL